MKGEKISGGNAKLGQLFVLVLLLPLCFYLFHIVLTKNQSFEGLGFLTIFTGTALFFIKMAFDYSDIYLIENQILISNLFTNKSKNISEYKTIENALMPLKYCIKFEDGSKTYFALNTIGIFKNLASLDPDRALKELNTAFIKLKQQSNQAI